MRYLVVAVTADGRERLGMHEHFERYASVDNVIRFGLRKDKYPSGQYHIYTWPEGFECSKTFRTAYKRADTPRGGGAPDWDAYGEYLGGQ
jgi:hypothetical protein